MGNCCGKPSSSSQNFSGEGRTLGAQLTTAAPPSGSAKISAPQAGRTLGKNPQAPSSSLSPAEAARKAAEERASASQSSAQKGRLGKALDAQKSQTQSDTLQQNARENLAARDADAAAVTRNYN